MTKKTLQEVPFKNDIGQEINPGDSVVIVTSGYNHSVNTAKGTYLGKTGDGVTCSVYDLSLIHI